MIQRREYLKRSGKPLRRGKRLKAKGGSLFPKRRDRAYLRWCLAQLKVGVPCDNCGMGANSRAHLIPRSRGGPDLDNIAFLCSGPGSNGCHERSEKQVSQFIAEGGGDLFAAARRHTNAFRQRRGPAPEAQP